MNDTIAPGGAPDAAAAMPLPKVRMDRSRAYATIHGERGPGDRHAGIQFIQDGIPADASGHFVFDHPDMAEPGPEGDKRRRAAERKLKKAVALQAKQPKSLRAADDGQNDDEADRAESEDEEDAKDDELDPINLEAWLRGEQQVEWQEVTQEIARRYKRRISKLEDAVAFLVREGVVPRAQLQRKFQKFAD